MDEVLGFLLEHGYLLLFAVVFLSMLGLPVPSSPAVLAMGALVAEGYFGFAPALLAAAAAALLANLAWYLLGRWRGERVLRWLCRFSWNSEACFERARRLMGRRGAWSLLLTRFVAGVSTAAPAAAGIARLHPARFLALDAAGSVIWNAVYLILGYLFHDQLEAVAGQARRLGAWIFVLLAAAACLYVLWVYRRRAARPTANNR